MTISRRFATVFGICLCLGVQVSGVEARQDDACPNSCEACPACVCEACPPICSNVEVGATAGVKSAFEEPSWSYWLAAKPETQTKKAKATTSQTNTKAQTTTKAKATKTPAKSGNLSTKAVKNLKPKLTAEERKVVLHGVRNTRQLGGLPTTDGRFVKRDVLYRSGALCNINDADVETLKDKGIKSIVELRTTQEIQTEGRDKQALVGNRIKIYNCPMYCTTGLGAEAYASFIREHDYKSISTFFKVLANEGSYPVLYHCSAGKDRTGILSALVLELLRVPRPIIMDDYLTSQRNSPGLKVEADWLRVVFKAIDQAGGIEKFLQIRGVSNEEMRAIRQFLLVNK